MAEKEIKIEVEYDDAEIDICPQQQTGTKGETVETETVMQYETENGYEMVAHLQNKIVDCDVKKKMVTKQQTVNGEVETETLAENKNKTDGNRSKHIPPAVVNINISGTLFHIQQTMLAKFPLSRLANLTRVQKNYSKEKKEYTYYTDPVIFNSILDAYRTGRIHIPSGTCAERFKQDLAFWGLPLGHVSPCCWQAMHEGNDDLSLVELTTDAILNSVDAGVSEDGHLTSRQKLWLFVEKPNTCLWSWIWAIVMGLFVLWSTILLFVDTLPSIREDSKITEALSWMERSCYFILTIEMVICIATCPNWIGLLLSWMHWFELLSCLTFWVVNSLEIYFDIESSQYGTVYLVFKYLTVLRVIRLLRVVSNIEEFCIICLTIRRSLWNCFILATMLFLTIIIFASLFYMTSALSKPEQFNSWKSNAFMFLYWPLNRGTTEYYAGSDDYTAKSFVAGMSIICGLVCFMMFVSAIVSKYHETSKCYRAVKSQFDWLLATAKDGKMIRARENDSIALVRWKKFTYSFKYIPTFPDNPDGSYFLPLQNIESRTYCRIDETSLEDP